MKFDIFSSFNIIAGMHEKWWRRGDPNSWSLVDSTNEDALAIVSVRKEWEILKGNGIGITIYRTPAGIFRAEEESDGTLIRLEKIERS